jgi:hypothetical protein
MRPGRLHTRARHNVSSVNNVMIGHAAGCRFQLTNQPTDVLHRHTHTPSSPSPQIKARAGEGALAKAKEICRKQKGSTERLTVVAQLESQNRQHPPGRY